jgi:hypothetical protein
MPQDEKMRWCEPAKFSATPAAEPLLEKNSAIYWELQRLLAECSEKRGQAEAGVAACGAGKIGDTARGKVAAYTFVLTRLDGILKRAGTAEATQSEPPAAGGYEGEKNL